MPVNSISHQIVAKIAGTVADRVSSWIVNSLGDISKLKTTLLFENLAVNTSLHDGRPRPTCSQHFAS